MSQLKTSLLAGCLFLCCSQAFADDEGTSSTAGAEALTAFESSSVLSDTQLNSQRAKENIEIDQITINDQEQDGNVSDNVAVDNTTGDNTIGADSFTNTTGFISTVQNTGNNVLIQHSTIINVSLDNTPSN